MAGERQKNVRRFIPARTGNTCSLPQRTCGLAVHPRTHGEHVVASPAPVAVIGSSPHARGTQPLVSLRDQARRFIPARTGNTVRVRVPNTSHPVHPRTHGEHDASELKPDDLVGSSPHARGTRMMEADTSKLPRFIPARTGNTTTSARTMLPSSVHPRTHGEHSVLSSAIHMIDGSSPHARGTLIIYSPKATSIRFIPARTGNTSVPETFVNSTAVHPRTHGEHFIWRRNMR